MALYSKKGIRDRIADLRERISGYGADAYAALSRLLSRVPLWSRKLEYGEAVGQTHDRQDSWYQWELGATERHCTDCLRLNGQIHTAEEWRSAGISPQSPDLECGGWNCDCRFTMVANYEGAGEGQIA